MVFSVAQVLAEQNPPVAGALRVTRPRARSDGLDAEVQADQGEDLAPSGRRSDIGLSRTTPNCRELNKLSVHLEGAIASRKRLFLDTPGSLVIFRVILYRRPRGSPPDPTFPPSLRQAAGDKALEVLHQIVEDLAGTSCVSCDLEDQEETDTT